MEVFRRKSVEQCLQDVDDPDRHLRRALGPIQLTAIGIGYNVHGIGSKLRLDGDALASIYMWAIKRWNDPRIVALNHGLRLPALNITPIYANGSGDTYVFTDYLSKVSGAWKHQVGTSTTVSWPTGIGGNKNAGVAAIVQNTAGSIGYVSTFYAIQNHLGKPQLKNGAGKYVVPRISSIEAAAQLVKGAKIPANNKISLTDPPKSKKYASAWPISTSRWTTAHSAATSRYPRERGRGRASWSCTRSSA